LLLRVRKVIQVALLSKLRVLAHALCSCPFCRGLGCGGWCRWCP